ncbi:MAG: 30S ribosomal protein S2 [Anaerolineales bacterium]
MSLISMKSLLETGVHFGHRTQKWHPRMKPYIFTERNGIHIIDLQQTVESLDNAYNLTRDTVARGGTLLFLGTKRQAQEAIQKEAERCSMPYVNQRWLGGTLTNWKTIKEQINELKRLEDGKASGKFDALTKKENLMIDRRVTKLLDRIGGIRTLNKLPDLLFIVDVRREATAVHEANVLGVPIIALVDTNCDPSGVDFVIPSNDDAIRAIKLMTAKIADAALDGLNMRKDLPASGDDEDQYGEPDAKDEDLLGPAVRAKMASGELEFSGSEESGNAA